MIFEKGGGAKISIILIMYTPELISRWSGLPTCNVILILTLFILLLAVYFISHLAILHQGLVWLTIDLIEKIDLGRLFG